MKFLILTLLSLPVFAAEICSTSAQNEQVLETVTISTDVPSHLKGATIVVRLADGRESKVPAELFKVVPRKQQRLVTKLSSEKTISCLKTSETKNRLSLLGGYGTQKGLKRSVRSDGVDVETRAGVVGGIQYQRSLTERFSVGVQGQTNATGSLMIGVDF